ncbi:MOSC domain-containing protein [Lujinxingia vulgaris]|uniref:MOSC domain-containing protein n=1 Tax=Lujinxingia vulgaris TaxID=2600176 RepID=A0A5C6WXV3_9DELT|nr:MOSC domain-containing protein [Lujinxingia vulgaris]TXD34265.1 MOSC domain-containing protein [Lujinxingia vulgaris]
MIEDAHIVSLRVGMPRELGRAGAKNPLERSWRSGFVKEAVQGPLWLDWENFEGDGQADRKHHGGVEKAVCVYPVTHLAYWSERMGRAMGPGAFGENVSVAGLDEREVCVGDVYRLGGALVRVTQPRSPCWKLARIHGEKAFALWVQQTGFCGWYFGVVERGYVQVGQALKLEERPYPQWSIAEVHAVRYHRPDDLEAAAFLAGCPALSQTWRVALEKRVARGEESDEVRRLIGPNEG